MLGPSCAIIMSLNIMKYNEHVGQEWNIVSPGNNEGCITLLPCALPHVEFLAWGVHCGNDKLIYYPAVINSN